MSINFSINDKEIVFFQSSQLSKSETNSKAKSELKNQLINLNYIKSLLDTSNISDIYFNLFIRISSLQDVKEFIDSAIETILNEKIKKIMLIQCYKDTFIKLLKKCIVFKNIKVLSVNLLLPDYKIFEEFSELIEYTGIEELYLKFLLPIKTEGPIEDLMINKELTIKIFESINRTKISTLLISNFLNSERKVIFNSDSLKAIGDILKENKRLRSFYFRPCYPIANKKIFSGFCYLTKSIAKNPNILVLNGMFHKTKTLRDILSQNKYLKLYDFMKENENIRYVSFSKNDFEELVTKVSIVKNRDEKIIKEEQVLFLIDDTLNISNDIPTNLLYMKKFIHIEDLKETLVKISKCKNLSLMKINLLYIENKENLKEYITMIREFIRYRPSLNYVSVSFNNKNTITSEFIIRLPEYKFEIMTAHEVDCQNDTRYLSNGISFIEELEHKRFFVGNTQEVVKINSLLLRDLKLKHMSEKLDMDETSVKYFKMLVDVIYGSSMNFLLYMDSHEVSNLIDVFEMYSNQKITDMIKNYYSLRFFMIDHDIRKSLINLPTLNYEYLFDDPVTSDVIIKIPERKFRVHKLFLCSQSEFMRSMILGVGRIMKKSKESKETKKSKEYEESKESKETEEYEESKESKEPEESKESKQVDIFELNENRIKNFERMLRSMYSFRVDLVDENNKCSIEEVIELYMMADYYLYDNLKKMLMKVFKRNKDELIKKPELIILLKNSTSGFDFNLLF